MAEEKTDNKLMLLAIVSIVAIVGIVAMLALFSGRGNTKYISAYAAESVEGTGDNLAGQGAYGKIKYQDPAPGGGGGGGLCGSRPSCSGGQNCVTACQNLGYGTGSCNNGCCNCA